jgi:prophage regulatory protein
MTENVAALIDSVDAKQFESLPERLIRFSDVARITTLSRGWVWMLERNGQFPKRVQLGRSAVAWNLREVQEWVANRPRVTVGEKAKVGTRGAA